MPLTVACTRCNRMYHYADRGEIDKLCPDCDNGPFSDWMIGVGVKV